MKIGIDMGHPFGCGAFGIMSETDGNRAVGKLVMEKLQLLGHTVINCTYDTNLNELGNRVALANAQRLDYFLSLHMDSFDSPSSNGVTIYTTANSSAKSKAIEIVNKVAESCDYYNRGWKSANFYVLRNTNSPAMLLEIGFVTNQADCDRFNPENIANAIVEAITGQSVNKIGWIQDSTGWWYKNEDGSYPKDCWKYIKDIWYYFGSDGYMRTGWIDTDGHWYYLKDLGGMARNETLEINGKEYNFNDKGEMM